jgi:hypothetical protein
VTSWAFGARRRHPGDEQRAAIVSIAFRNIEKEMPAERCCSPCLRCALCFPVACLCSRLQQFVQGANQSSFGGRKNEESFDTFLAVGRYS